MNISRWCNHRSKYESRQEPRRGAGLNFPCFPQPLPGPHALVAVHVRWLAPPASIPQPFGLKRWFELFRREDEAKRSRAAKAICTET